MSLPTDTQARTIPLEQLAAHPANSNVMPPKLFDKLAAEIDRTGLYPPIIVRQLGEGYQILDGHHRARALRQAGAQKARCVVWQTDDQQALLLLATLNRLSGEDDPRKRAALLDQLHETMGVDELARRLPEDRERVRKLMALHAAPPSPIPPTPIDQMPVSLSFFLMPHERRAVEARLDEHGGPRERALLELLGLGGIDEQP